MRRLALLLAALAAAGCMGGDEARFEASQLERLVLRRSDLAVEWVQFDEGRQIGADQPGGVRSDPARFGRIEGWKARYRRPGTPATEGPLVIESRADVFEDEGGARDDLDAHRSELSAEWRRLRDPELGDEAFAAILTQANVRFFVVAWRTDNATASISANGFELSLDGVLVFARRQQQRIAAQA